MSNDTPGIINPTDFYLASEARRRLHLGEWAWRRMRRKGLRIYRSGRQAFVCGRDLIEILQSESRADGGQQ